MHLTIQRVLTNTSVLFYSLFLVKFLSHHEDHANFILGQSGGAYDTRILIIINAWSMAEGRARTSVKKSASDSNAKGSGFAARQEQEFSSSYETPESLGAEDSRAHVLRMRR
jgi:hypothetical protein